MCLCHCSFFYVWRLRFVSDATRKYTRRRKPQGLHIWQFFKKKEPSWCSLVTSKQLHPHLPPIPLFSVVCLQPVCLHGRRSLSVCLCLSICRRAGGEGHFLWACRLGLPQMQCGIPFHESTNQGSSHTGQTQKCRISFTSGPVSVREGNTDFSAFFVPSSITLRWFLTQLSCPATMTHFSF